MPRKSSKPAVTHADKLYSDRNEKMLSQLDELINELYKTADVAGRTDSFEILDNIESAYFEVCVAVQKIKDTYDLLH